MPVNWSAHAHIQEKLMECNEDLTEHVKGEVLLLKSAIGIGLDDIIRRNIEGLPNLKKTKLTVILETNGGYIEVVERIVNVFRKHFRTVDFIVPNFAYSAGTVLCMSGDTIFMNYFSVLGPIDPQVENAAGTWVPATGYLEKWKELVAKSNAGTLSTAELAYMLEKFDAAELYFIEQASEQSVTLLKQWLVKYKFKDWKVTETRGLPVTKKMKEDRAEEIAKLLADASFWHSHGRGIHMDMLRSPRMKVRIEDFGETPELSGLILDYYDLFIDFCDMIGCAHALHTRDGFRRLQ